MKTSVIHLHRAAPPKPAPGAPCNGCGVCCALETCPAARLRFLRVRGPCPALHWSAEAARYHCGLVSQPEAWLPGLPAAWRGGVGRWFARWIAAGIGCDCDAEVATDEAAGPPA